MFDLTSTLPADVDARRLLEALNFAALRHSGQRRKGIDGAPYINHLIEVAYILARHGVTDMDLLCAALLHDAVEDVGVQPDELRARFGARVTTLVLAVTDDPTLPVADRKTAQVAGAAALPAAAQNLRIADKISNLRGILTSPPENWSIERRLAYYGWARAVVEACEGGLPSLRQTFTEIHEGGRVSLELQAARIRRGERPPRTE
jgi:guanosine-3',5'-bis(diphosphate) 3'-pyrophosphohydrolase